MTMEISNQHFAENPEALEDFVLGRLDQKTLARCEKHLRTCEKCRQAVHVEQIIAAGMKREGREQLKERIGMLAGTPPRRKVPWPHVLSAAAILLILAGVGIYQRWFVTHAPSKDIIVQEHPQLEAREESKVSDGMDEPAPAPAVTARPSEIPARKRDAEQARRSAGNNATRQNEKSGHMGAPDDRLEGAPARASKDKRMPDIAARASAGSAGPQEFWANGTLIKEPLSKKEAEEGEAAKSVATGALHTADAAGTKTETYGHVVVDQRPVSELPASRQAPQRFDSQAIQTHVRQSGGETQLTLYPASPFDTTQLRHARVLQVAPDSLVLEIGNHRIGYRFSSVTLEKKQAEEGK